MNEPNLPATEPAAIAPGEEAGNPRWERATIEKLLFESLKEKRRARRWGIFLKLLFLGWLTVACWPPPAGCRATWPPPPCGTPRWST
mgnify:CR=1 FL=1